MLALDPPADALEFEGRWYTWGELGATADAVAAARRPPGRRGAASCCGTGRRRSGCLLGVLRAGGVRRDRQPGRGADRTRADLAALDLPVLAGEPDDLAGLVTPGGRPGRRRSA